VQNIYLNPGVLTCTEIRQRPRSHARPGGWTPVEPVPCAVGGPRLLPLMPGEDRESPDSHGKCMRPGVNGDHGQKAARPVEGGPLRLHPASRSNPDVAKATIADQRPGHGLGQGDKPIGPRTGQRVDEEFNSADLSQAVMFRADDDPPTAGPRTSRATWARRAG